MTLDVSGYMLAIIAIGITFVASRSSYWILKMIASLCWLVVTLFWLANAPAGIAKGSPVDTTVILVLFFIVIACMFWIFWKPNKGSNGQEGNGRLRIPFLTPSDEEEEEEKQRRYMPTRAERTRDYKERANSALRGERRRRY